MRSHRLGDKGIIARTVIIIIIVAVVIVIVIVIDAMH